ncbi:hypothetical protein A7985_11420 [Pseudoalteromonas luteoviolacea]|uniref:Uncharacterized protein n=1 Tax=Pseudoalteromonas luteoviolacea TaxID=43657 RepID=A0A1C0TQL5_9GAMM|nr:hypothetical protein [Pseudoalteromonas luteoviolacea]MBQ4811473.1 hypothetical protein [Pseudoalteromonas luteoviolacea]OCQ21231.1 hypothetical protein A7985_11420 [Pseudoalteromonas luteoviolacea]
MSIKSKIDCPECTMPIYFESNLLLAGQSFSCSNPNCDVSIALTATDKEVVSNAFNKFEQIRESATTQAGRHDS